MSQSLPRTTDGIPVVEDRYLYPSSTETFNAWELVAGLEQHRVNQEGNHEDLSLPSSSSVEKKRGIYKAKRSKSSQWLPENEIPPRVPRDFDRLDGLEFKWGSKGVVRARSFHTVEEYDAMVETIHLAGGPKMQLPHSKWSSKKPHRLDYYPSKNSTTDERGTPLTVGPGTREMLPSLTDSISAEKSQTFEDAAHEGSSSISGKGLKRKAIGKGLNSIQVPSTAEFPSVANLREWLYQGGQVYSPGAYVTPKFGSYNISKPRPRKERSEESIFDPNLVAAFEECMQQLEAEEDTVLRGIEQVLEKDHANDTEAEEESSSNNDKGDSAKMNRNRS
ncbi:hypothetical protein RHGRI_037034 [Rhododendron griersonianum]|uniref:Uncharacterized protein n=1 Tax=Rhododendron griersonianum TaxID=479676 RepID=A0AAV6HRD1_9ERIC|nr:hypothetical protein RHGRI_037034 [Rhododendron griersonianum]